MKLFFERPAVISWRFVLLVATVVLAGSYFYFGQGKGPGATLVVIPSDFREQVSVSGTVIAVQDVSLGFAASGRISGTYARVGQYVTAGSILAEIENGDLRAALAEAQAELASLKAGTRPEEVAVASAAVTSAQAALIDSIQGAYTAADDAVHNTVDAFFINPRTANPKLSFLVANSSVTMAVEQDRASMEQLLAAWALLVTETTNESAAVSAKQSQAYLAEVVVLLADANAAVNQGLPDAATSAAKITSYGTSLATARASVNAAATALTTDQTALDSAQKNLTLKQAGSTSEAIAAQEASVENARALLAKTRVVAPFGGTVTRMEAKVGEIVSPTSSEISMQSNGIFQIETYVPEVTIPRIASGNPATTTLDAYGSAIAFPSKVVAVDPAETLKDGVPTYKTTLSFLAVDPRIRSGMTANVLMETGVLKDAIVIPAGAVGQKDGVAYVSVVENGTVVARAVTTGPSPALGQAHILSGLSAGDVILLSPAP